MKILYWSIIGVALVVAFGCGDNPKGAAPSPSNSSATALNTPNDTDSTSHARSNSIILDEAKQDGLLAAWVGGNGFSAAGLRFDGVTAEYPASVNGAATDAVLVTYSVSNEPAISIELFTMKPKAWEQIRDRLPNAGTTGVVARSQRIYSSDRTVFDVPSGTNNARELWVTIDMRDGDGTSGARLLGLSDRIVVIHAPSLLVDGRTVMTPERIEGLVRTQLFGYGSALADAVPADSGLENEVTQAADAGITTYWVGPQAEAGGFFTDTIGGKFEKGRSVDPGDAITLSYISLIETRIDFEIRSMPLSNRAAIEAMLTRRGGDPRTIDNITMAGRPAMLVRILYPDGRKLHALTLLLATDDAFIVASAGGLIGPGNEELNVLISNPESFLALMATLRPYPK